MATESATVSPDEVSVSAPPVTAAVIFWVALSATGGLLGVGAHLGAGDVPFTGTVSIDGRDLGSYEPADLAWRRAVLPQKSTLSFPFTVNEVVRMGRAPWLPGPESDRAIADAMRLTETDRLAAAYADRAYVLAAGRVEASGPPADIFTEPLLTRVYAQPVEIVPHPHAPLIVPRR